MTDDVRSGVPAGAAVPLAGVLGLSAAAALVPLNSTMIAVALPAIADDFSVSTAEVSVLVTLYLVIMLVGQPIAGRVADAVGSGRVVRAALFWLAACSALAALATSYPMLLVARGLQAVCATALGPGIQAMLRAGAPRGEHGRVFGIFNSTMGAGAASGPIVGGVLVGLLGWRGIFVVNVPVALLAVAAIVVAAPRARSSVAEPLRPASGDAAPPAAGATGRILNPVFVAGFASQAFATQAQYALLLLTPIVLDARGWGAGSVGLVLAALTIGTIVTGPLGGRLGDETGRRLPSLVGIATAAIATSMLTVPGRSVDVVVLTLGLALFGIGFGATAPNLLSAALGSVPDGRVGVAAGIFTTSRYVGSITTTSLIAAFVADDATGTRTVLAISTGCTVAALVAARWLPGAPASGVPGSDGGALRSRRA